MRTVIFVVEFQPSQVMLVSIVVRELLKVIAQVSIWAGASDRRRTPAGNVLVEDTGNKASHARTKRSGSHIVPLLSCC